MSAQYRNHLFDNFEQSFSIDDLKSLCFRLHIDHEQLRWNTKSSLARELIAYCENHNRIDQLIQKCQKLRPDVSWPIYKTEPFQGKTKFPKGKMIELLHSWDEWAGLDIGNRNNAYHQEYIDFRINFDQPEEIQPEAFSFAYQNQYTHLSQANFYCGSTPLFEISFVLCDHMRIFFPAPDPRVIYEHPNEIYYHYIELDSSAGAFLKLLSKGTLSFESRFYSAPILIYADSEERRRFEEHVVDNLESVNLLEPNVLMEQQQQILLNNGRWAGKGYDLVFLDKMKRCYKAWQNT